MLTIRLTRVGKKKDASFRVVVVDSKRKVQAGNYLEMVGSYDPRVNKAELNAERIKHWIACGAKTSDTVHNLLVSQKIIEGKKINVLPRKSPPANEEVAETPVTVPAAGNEPSERPSATPEEATRSEEGLSPEAGDVTNDVAEKEPTP